MSHVSVSLISVRRSARGLGHSRIGLLLAAVLIAAPCVAGDAATLDITLADGSQEVVVPAGGTFNAVVSFAGPPGTEFNAALFRLILTVESCQVLEYEWRAPFVTGGATDVSLRGLTLPVSVMDETLAGPGYPIDTADVEFGNFDFFQSSSGGALVDVTLRAPPDAKPGTVFFVVAVPDIFSDGFTPIPTEVGLLLSVEIANSDVVGDLSGDGVVNSQDLAILLGNWGGKGVGDLDGDALVSAFDLAILLGAWTR